MMVGPPPVADIEQNLRIANLSQALARICDELLVPYFEIYAALQDRGVWMAEVAANDGSHPGAAGYAELARLVSAWPAWRAWFTLIGLHLRDRAIISVTRPEPIFLQRDMFTWDRRLPTDGRPEGPSVSIPASMKEPVRVAPTRNIWIHESLEDETRRLRERIASGIPV